MSNGKFQLREQWLHAVAAELNKKFQQLGHALPAYRLSVGFPSKGIRSKIIGECFHEESSADKSCQIFIHPSQTDSIDVAGILCHELCHAVLGHGFGHGAKFKKLAYAMGLAGKPTSTIPGPEFVAWFEPVLAKIGDYPHGRLNALAVKSESPKKQGTRMLKAACTACGYTVRTTQKWLDVAVPVCPDESCDNFQQAMETDSPEDGGDGGDGE